jgi:hypothetical protein
MDLRTVLAGVNATAGLGPNSPGPVTLCKQKYVSSGPAEVEGKERRHLRRASSQTPYGVR